MKTDAKRYLMVLLDLNMQNGSKRQKSNNAALDAGKIKAGNLS